MLPTSRWSSGEATLSRDAGFLQTSWECSLEMPFELMAHSFGPPRHWNISFLQIFDIWEQPEIILDAGLEDEEDTQAA